jgi:hypothetical protein
MENTDVETSTTTTPQKIVSDPVATRPTATTNSETVGNDLVKAVTEAATIIVDGTKLVVRVIIEAGDELSHDAKRTDTPALATTVTTVPPAGAM